MKYLQFSRRLLAGVLCVMLVLSCIPGNVLEVYATQEQTVAKAPVLWSQVSDLDKTTGGAWHSKANYGTEQAIFAGRNNPSAINPHLDNYSAEYTNYRWFGTGIDYTHLNTTSNAIQLMTSGTDIVQHLGGEVWVWRGRDADGFVTSTSALELPEGYTGTAPEYNAYATQAWVEMSEENAAIFHADKNPLSSNMTKRLIFTFQVPESKANTPYYFSVYTDTLSYVDAFSEDFELSFVDMNGNPLGEKIRLDTADFGKTGGYATFLVKGSFKLCMDKNANSNYFGLSAFFFDENHPYMWNPVAEMDSTAGGNWQSVGQYGDEQAILLGWNSAQQANDQTFEKGGLTVADDWLDTDLGEDELPGFNYGKGESVPGEDGTVYKWWSLGLEESLPLYTNAREDAIKLSVTADAATRLGDMAFFGNSLSAATPNVSVQLESAQNYNGTVPKYNTYTSYGMEDTAATHTLGFFDKQPLSAGMTHRVIAQFDIPESKAEKIYYFTVYADTLNHAKSISQNMEIYLMDLEGNLLSGKHVFNTADFGKDGGYITFRVTGSFMLCLDKPENQFGFSAFFFDEEQNGVPEVPEVDETLWQQSGEIDKTTEGKWQTKGYGQEQAILLGWNAAADNNEAVRNLPRDNGDYHNLPRVQISNVDANWIKNTGDNAIVFRNDDIWKQNMNSYLYLYKGSDEMGYPTYETVLETPEGFTGTVPNYNTYQPGGRDSVPLFTSIVPMGGNYTKRLAMRFDLPDAEQEYAFRLYADTKYTKYKVDVPVRLSFVSSSGEELYSSHEINASEFGKTGGYVTFKVKGSFVLLLDKMSWADEGLHSSSRFGFSAFFFDKYTEPETVEPQPEEKPSVHFAGMNVASGANWQSLYGSVDADLLGYGRTEGFATDDSEQDGAIVDTAHYIERETYDYILKGVIRPQFEGDRWFCYNKTSSTTLTNPNPNAPADLFSVYAAGGVTSDELAQARYENPGYMRNVFTFSGLEKDVPYLFTAYTDNGGDYSSRFEGNIIITFVNAEGEVVYQRKLHSSEFNGGAYISFVVKNGFTMIVDKESYYFGFSGFFFDEVSENFVNNLAVTAGSAPRSAVLTWNEGTSKSGDKVVLERKSPNSEWEEIAVLNTGVRTYTDTNLRSGTAYEYRAYTRSGVTASYITDAVEFTTATYTPVVLTLDKSNYTAKSNEEELTVKAILRTRDGEPCVGVPVMLHVDFDHSAYTLDAVNTDASGVATFVFKTPYMGYAKIYAYTDDFDAQQYAYATSEKSNALIGETAWEQAPVAYQVSDAVGVGDLFSITGYGFMNEDMSQMEIRYAPHTSAAVSATPVAGAKVMEVVQTDDQSGYFITTKLPEDEAPGLYDIWVNNGYGWSEPILLNQARPLFISEYEAWEGQTLKISGRCLQGAQFGAELSTWVRLVSGDTVVLPKMTKVTPYSLAFELNEGTPLGTYEVQVTNDSGTTWSTLQSGQTLTVQEVGLDPLNTGLAWMDDFKWDQNGDGEFTVANDTFNVKNYSCTCFTCKYLGGWGTDQTHKDTGAFDAAIAAASAAGGGVVYVPDGTYYISSLSLPAGVVIMGQSTEKTILTYAGSGGNMFVGKDKGRTEGRLGFANFSLRLANDSVRPGYYFVFGPEGEADPWNYPDKRKASEFFVSGISITDSGEYGNGGSGIFVLADERLLVENCDINAYSGALIAASRQNRYTTFRNNNIVYKCNTIHNNAMYSFFEDNYLCGDFGNLTDEEITDRRNTHGICVQGFAHVEGNVVENMGTKVNVLGASIHNDGESYLIESSVNYDYGYVVASTANTATVKMTVGSLQSQYAVPHDKLTMVINAGRGMGQIRRIESIDPETGIITIEGTWDVNPDYTSKFTFSAPSEGSTFYNNEDRNCAKGVYIYGNLYDAVVANHKGTNTEGVYIFGAQSPGVNTKIWWNFYATVRDCSFNGVSPRSRHVNISVGAERSISGGEYFGAQNFGMEIRNNVIVGDPDQEGQVPTDENGNPLTTTESLKLSGIGVGVGVFGGESDNVGGDNINVIVEDNRIEDTKQGIHGDALSVGLVSEGNTFVNVESPYTNSDVSERAWLRLDDVVTYEEISHLVSLWETADKEMFCQDSMADLQTAVAAAKTLSANAIQDQLDKALRDLRNAYASLTAHAYGAGVTKIVPETKAEQVTYTCSLCGKVKIQDGVKTGTLWQQVGAPDTTTGGNWYTVGDYGDEQAIFITGGDRNNSEHPNNHDYAGHWVGGSGNQLHIDTAADAITLRNDGDLFAEVYSYNYADANTAPANVAECKPAYETPDEVFAGAAFTPKYNAHVAWANNALSGTYALTEGLTTRNIATFDIPASKANTAYYFTVYINTAHFAFRNGAPEYDFELFLLDANNNQISERYTFNTRDFGYEGAYVTFLVKGSFRLVMDKVNADYGFNAFFFDPIEEELWSQAGVMDNATGGLWQTKGYGEEQAILLGWGNAGFENDQVFTYGGNGIYKWHGAALESGWVVHTNTSESAIKLSTTADSVSRFGGELSFFGDSLTEAQPNVTVALEAPDGYTGIVPKYNSYSYIGATPNGLSHSFRYFNTNPISYGMKYRVTAQFDVPESKADTQYYFTIYADTKNFVDEPSYPIEFSLMDLQGNLTGNKICLSTADFGENGGYLTFKVQGSFVLCMDKPEEAAHFGISAFFFDEMMPYGEPTDMEEAVSASITLDGTIGVNYGMNLSLAAKQDENTSMVFTQTGKDDKTVKLEDATWRNKLYWFKDGVAAKEMADTITGQMHFSNDLVGEKKTYSIREYANAALNLTDNAKLINLLKAMLNYGGYSQTYFAYNTEDLANSSLTEAEKSLDSVTVENLAPYAANVNGGDGTVQAKEASLLLRSGTILRLSFTTTEIAGMTIKLVTGNGEVELTPQQRNSKLSYVDVADIPAAELGNDFTVRIYDGETVVSTVTYCPLAYCYAVLGSSADVNLQNVVKALYLYYNAAVGYF